MDASSKLDNYLSILERSLKPFSTSDRADIITEIRSHILTATERDPGQSLDSVLSALGEPEIVANRYILERGLQPAKPPIRPIVKWLTIGFLGTFGLLLLFIGVIFLKFTPFLHITDNQITLLGGLVNIDGKASSIGKSSFSGMKRFPSPSKETIEIRFSNGETQVKNSGDSSFQWECKVQGRLGPVKSLEQVSDRWILDLSAVKGMSCVFQIPEVRHLQLKGMNGEVVIDQPRYPLDLNLMNGEVGLTPDQNLKYHYQLQVTHGDIGSFSSSDDPKAIPISIQLINGDISHRE